MTAEEKLIIEQLLANCSPTVQSIVNAENKFMIPPPFDDEESDEEYSSDEEDNDKLAGEVMGTVQNESNQPKVISLTQQPSLTISDIEEKNKLTTSQQITPFDTEEHSGEDASKQPHPYDISNVSIYYQYC